MVVTGRNLSGRGEGDGSVGGGGNDVQGLAGGVMGGNKMEDPRIWDDSNGYK